MKYVYPAILTPAEEGFRIRVPDLPGLVTYGETLPDALYMAQDAIEMWLWDAENKHETIPPASSQTTIQKKTAVGEFVNLVPADTDEYRRQNDTRSIKKTLTIPSWLNYEAEKANAPFSQILQQGLKAYLEMRE